MITNTTLEVHLCALRDSIDRLSMNIERTHARIDADIRAKEHRRFKTKLVLFVVFCTVQWGFIAFQMLTHSASEKRPQISKSQLNESERRE